MTENEKNEKIEGIIARYALTFKTPFLDDSIKKFFFEKKSQKTYANFRGRIIEKK
jgi:hypothetical protein